MIIKHAEAKLSPVPEIQFLLNYYDNNWVKIVDFLLIAYLWAWVKFSLKRFNVHKISYLRFQRSKMIRDNSQK